MATFVPSPNAQSLWRETAGPEFQHINMGLGLAFDAIGMESPVFFWPRETETQARGTKGTIREISDIRALAESYVGTSIDYQTYIHAWHEPYAPDVLYGNGTTRPGRDWIEYTLSQTSPQDFSR